MLALQGSSVARLAVMDDVSPLLPSKTPFSFVTTFRFS